MTLSFEPSEAGIDVVDPVERRTTTLAVPGGVDPTPADADAFTFPVDGAVAVRTDAVTLPTAASVYVRNDAGEMVASAECGSRHELQSATYSVELCTPVKLYLRVESAVTVSAAFDGVELSFDDDAEVLIGGRSHQRRPPATVTTTQDPGDVMAAISTFGSALKTTSPERSFPTLRGHPPAVELGDELRIPDGLSPPDTGVRVEVPPSLGHVYPVAPLAYYLGAEVVPGNAPKLVADGYEHPLDSAHGFETEVERVLKGTFLLDCVTRTEGYYPVDLHERREVEPLVDLDFAALYDAPLAERLAAYLDVSYALLEPHVPEWQLSARVAPDPGNVETLPFVVDDLAVVRTPSATDTSASNAPAPSSDEFARSGDFTRSASESSPTNRSLVEPESTDSLDQLWVGDDTPVGAHKATAEAFRNRLERTPGDGEIDITVVCNDRAMDEERTVADEVYGSRETLPFDVTVRHELTTDELRDALAADTQFFHYIGHIDENGIECVDGYLDARALDSVGVESFFLNACQSYEQGTALIEGGAVGGVVTLNDVVNSGAVRVGKAMARLLNRGFPLRAALNVAQDRSIVGEQYLVVGDGNLDVVQSESVIPVLVEIETISEAEFELTPRSFVSSEGGLGSFVTPKVGPTEKCYLSSGTLETYTLTRDELRQHLMLEVMPLLFDGEFVWSDAVDEF
ncbi:hypothetical protein [Halomicrococcus gelatinilyticus]|uniref:hypothetical protein n=1 Tax=Halomicrococcus gelatinilyticus TaxID=1702103 RepID=UPI002E10C013